MSNSNSIPLPPRVKDLTGRVFTRLTVVGYAGKQGKEHRWLVRCRCGTEKVTQGNNLASGSSRSCGCLCLERTSEANSRHHGTGTREFSAWAAMWRRCTNPSDRKYPIYKDRAPPPEWRDFSIFLSELGPKPSPNHTLDRIDNEKPYGPGNCRWALPSKQSRNMSRNVWVQVAGQRRILHDACLIVGINPKTLYSRLSRGQSLEQASVGTIRAV